MIIIDLQDRRLDKGEGFRKEVDLSTSRDVSSERFSSLNAIVRLVVLFAGPTGRLLGFPDCDFGFSRDDCRAFFKVLNQ